MAPRTAPDRIANARERFLSAEPLDGEVIRKPILASWQRSRHFRVAADRIDLRYIREPDPETMLVRAAQPVLRRLHEQLDGQPVSIILTDANGLVLSRLTADHDLERYLESVMLAPGFSYAEELVGTNGIGTALEAGGPAHVFGHEHYAEKLEGLACAGVPLHDPLSGKTIGLIDLTCWRRNADALLLSLVQSTAEQIAQSLAAASCGRDVRLLEEYVRACKRGGGIVLALGNDVVMMNDHARSVLDPGDQQALIDRASEVLSARRSGAVTLELPSGAAARMSCRRVSDGPRADGVVQVRLLAVDAVDPGATPGAARSPMYLPGLVGNGVLWLRACRAAEAAYEAAEWFALDGEPGAGKLAVARAVHQRQNPAAAFHVLDAALAAEGSADARTWMAQARAELLDGTGVLVIQHVDTLTIRQLHTLASALQEARAQGRQAALRVMVTLHRDNVRADLTKLLRFFPRTVEVPPLRHHVEDLHELVPFLLARLSQHGRVTCSPQAMQLLQRHSWPGNIEQLWRVLRQVVQSRRSGSIKPKDLPPECWTVSRRLLNPLESIERDAIVASLLDHDGNKVKAAEALGMSRATIYRKIHEYGIVTVSK